MPLYDYECIECNHIFERFSSIEKKDFYECPKCYRTAKLLITCNKRDWFRPHWNEDITGTPIYIESKEHYKKVCKDNGVFARCLL